MFATVTPPETEIYTLDLPLQSQRTLESAKAIGSAFRNTTLTRKIQQLWGDSTTFDFAPYVHSFDLVFVDANHNYEYVKQDTETAFQLVRPGGIIIWDDYVWDERYSHCAGVTKCLNEIAATRPCYQIKNTRLAIHISKD